MAKMKHLEIKIYGRVQGVSFRWFTKMKAGSLGVKGFVQNMPDGSVYIEAEGDKENLEKLIVWCKKGPMFAKVTKIDYKFSEDLKNFKDFKINYQKSNG